MPTPRPAPSAPCSVSPHASPTSAAAWVSLCRYPPRCPRAIPRSQSSSARQSQIAAAVPLAAGLDFRRPDRQNAREFNGSGVGRDAYLQELDEVAARFVQHCKLSALVPHSTPTERRPLATCSLPSSDVTFSRRNLCVLEDPRLSLGPSYSANSRAASLT